MIAKMLLPYGGTTSTAVKNKQATKIGICQTKGTIFPSAPISDALAALRTTHSRTIGVAKIPVPQKLGKSIQRFRRLRDQGGSWGSRCAERKSVLFNLLPESPGDLNSHATAFSIREKQREKEFCH
jgi:hypothetical protein